MAFCRVLSLTSFLSDFFITFYGQLAGYKIPLKNVSACKVMPTKDASPDVRSQPLNLHPALLDDAPRRDQRFVTFVKSPLFINP